MASDQPRPKPDGAPDASSRPGAQGVVTTAVTRLRSTDSKGRPMAVYAVLGVGVTALILLLLIVYFTANQRENPDQPICTTVDPSSVGNAIREGQVERLTLAYDDQVETPTADRWGPVLAKVDYSDGTCANLPQGILSQGGIYAIIGVINFYNETTENTQVEIKYDGFDNLDEALYVTPTVPPTPTPTVPVTPTAVVTPEATAPVIPEPSATPIGTPVTPAEATPAR